MELDDILTFVNSASPEKVVPNSRPKKVKPKRKIKTVIIDEMSKQYFTEAFSNATKLKTSDMVGFSNHKTIFGKIIKARDKIINVAVINAEGILTNRFISISFKCVSYTEFKEFLEKYIIVKTNKRYATIVERVYMEDIQYANHRQRIVEQFYI